MSSSYHELALTPTVQVHHMPERLVGGQSPSPFSGEFVELFPDRRPRLPELRRIGAGDESFHTSREALDPGFPVVPLVGLPIYDRYTCRHHYPVHSGFVWIGLCKCF
uniref:Uncharacterized protein n=1 Tax=Opuntia streptacantha TaxID=393608 RepID=A0A7C8YKM2_OPUST